MTDGDQEQLRSAVQALSEGAVDQAMADLFVPLGSTDELVRGGALFVRALVAHGAGDESVAVAFLCAASEAWSKAAPDAVTREVNVIAGALHREGESVEALRLLSATNMDAADIHPAISRVIANAAESPKRTSSTPGSRDDHPDAERVPVAVRPLVAALRSGDVRFAASEIDSLLDTPPDRLSLTTFVELCNEYAELAVSHGEGDSAQQRLQRVSELLAAAVPGPGRRPGELLAASRAVEGLRVRSVLEQADRVEGTERMALLERARSALGPRLDPEMTTAVYLSLARHLESIPERLAAGLEAARVAPDAATRGRVADVLGAMGDVASEAQRWGDAVSAFAAAVALLQANGQDEMARAMQLVLAAAETAAERNGIGENELEKALSLARLLTGESAG